MTWRDVLRLKGDKKLSKEEIDSSYFTLVSDINLRIHAIEEKYLKSEVGGVNPIMNDIDKVREIAHDYGDTDLLNILENIGWYLRILELKEQKFDLMEARLEGILEYLQIKEPAIDKKKSISVFDMKF